jgi:hypothetical protein
VTAVLAPAPGVPVHRRRVRPNTRHPRIPTSGFPSGSIPAGRSTSAVGHRIRASHAGCDDARRTERAAAVRRRRVLLGTVTAALIVALALPWGGAGTHTLAASGPTQAGATSVHRGLYIVQPGDTLWSIAEDLDPRGDPRPVVAVLSAQAGGDTVVPGERLELP